jgi:hypothetical protein
VPLRLRAWGPTEAVSPQCGQAMATMNSEYGDSPHAIKPIALRKSVLNPKCPNLGCIDL